MALGLRLPQALPHCVPDSLRVGEPLPGTLRVLQGEGEALPLPLPHSVPPRLLVALLEKVALGEKEVLGVRLRLPQGEGRGRGGAVPLWQPLTLLENVALGV